MQRPKALIAATIVAVGLTLSAGVLAMTSGLVGARNDNVGKLDTQAPASFVVSQDVSDPVASSDATTDVATDTAIHASEPSAPATTTVVRSTTQATPTRTDSDDHESKEHDSHERGRDHHDEDDD